MVGPDAYGDVNRCTFRSLASTAPWLPPTCASFTRDLNVHVNRRILGREPPDGDGPPDTGVPRMTSAGTGDRKIRRAAVIRQKLTIETSYEIAARARNAIEDDHRLLPAHTLGKCRCGEKLTIDDMEGHIAKNHARKGARRASLLKIVARTTGAPWMFAHAKPGTVDADVPP